MGIKKIKQFKIMKKLFTVLTMSLFLVFSGCDFFEKTSECDDGQLFKYSYYTSSSNAKFEIKILTSDVANVKVYATYNIKRCGQDDRVYYTTGTTTYYVDGPETINGDLVGYRCTTEIRNTEDVLNVYLYTIFTSTSGDVKQMTSIYRKYFNDEIFEPGFTVTFTGF
jgi:hypothetical protein